MSQTRSQPATKGERAAGVVGFQAGRPREDSHTGGDEQVLPITIARIAKGDGEVRISLDEFKGAKTIDIRLFERFTAASVFMPTKRGVTLGIAKLPELAAALAEAETQARQLGLIGGAE